MGKINTEIIKITFLFLKEKLFLGGIEYAKTIAFFQFLQP
jgi:hypothetical protein